MITGSGNLISCDSALLVLSRGKVNLMFDFPVSYSSKGTASGTKQAL